MFGILYSIRRRRGTAALQDAGALAKLHSPYGTDLNERYWEKRLCNGRLPASSYRQAGIDFRLQSVQTRRS